MSDRPLSVQYHIAYGCLGGRDACIGCEIAALEAERRELARHLDAANLRERRLVAKVERLERDVRWLLEGADDYWRTLPENAERFRALCDEMLEGREP